MSDRPQSGTLAWFFEPTWAGGWTATRWLFALAAAMCHLPRARGIGDAYGASDMVFTSGAWALANVFAMDERLAWGFWTVGVIGIALVAIGRQAFYPGMLLWAVGSWTLLAHEAVNVKAYDRLITWVALGLLFSPAGQGHLTRKWRSPFARYYLLLVYSAAYGSTGFLKLLKEPTWWTGEVLAYHLLHPWHGGKAIGVLISDQLWLTAFMGAVTVVFECAFPFYVWFRRANPVLLLVGFAFHLGLLVLMDVGPFLFVAICAYPVLLHPEIAHGLWLRLELRRGRDPKSADATRKAA